MEEIAEEFLEDEDECIRPDISQIITEDDIPVDNLACDKQQRLLVNSLYSHFQDRVFLAGTHVGIFHAEGKPPVVPDVFITYDVKLREDTWDKYNRSYLIWEFGKLPEVVIEIVSNQEGGELDEKFKLYQYIRICYYIVYDPSQHLGDKKLYVYILHAGVYEELPEPWIEQLKLGLTLWSGEFEQKQDTWLRWCDKNGAIYLTGEEQAQKMQQRSLVLAEKLKALGVDPDSL